MDSGGGDERSVGATMALSRFDDIFSPSELSQFESALVLQQRVAQSVSLIANDLSRVFRAMSSSVPLDLLKARVRRLLLAHWALHRYLGYYQPMVYPAFLLTMVLPAQPSLRFRCFANLMQRPYFALMFDQVSSRRHGLRIKFFALFDQVLAHHCSGDIGLLLAEAVGDCSETFTGFGTYVGRSSVRASVHACMRVCVRINSRPLFRASKTTIQSEMKKCTPSTPFVLVC